MSHHPERTARNVRPVNQPPSFRYVSRRAAERQSSTSNRNLVNPVNLVNIFSSLTPRRTLVRSLPRDRYRTDAKFSETPEE